MCKEEFIESIRQIIFNNQDVCGIKSDDRLKSISVVLGINFKRWTDDEIYIYLKGMYDMLKILNEPRYYFENEEV
ncbi:MAG: hypothetical protein E6704_07020 [Anaerococcus prevotii]|nr:hypothetical protein [Anaerococcus prevotii]